MVERTINRDIKDSINKFIEEIKKKYNVTAIIYLVLMQKEQKMKIVI